MYAEFLVQEAIGRRKIKDKSDGKDHNKSKEYISLPLIFTDHYVKCVRYILTLSTFTIKIKGRYLFTSSIILSCFCRGDFPDIKFNFFLLID
ncbi:hypothetical protein B1689_13750 [Geobacillus sp. 44C]|nr:hypothetical protein B1689_13750 [Geobacillus sp. 44C]